MPSSWWPTRMRPGGGIRRQSPPWSSCAGCADTRRSVSCWQTVSVPWAMTRPRRAHYKTLSASTPGSGKSTSTWRIATGARETRSARPGIDCGPFPDAARGNPKSETNPKHEAEKRPRSAGVPPASWRLGSGRDARAPRVSFLLGISDLFRISSFGFRICPTSPGHPVEEVIDQPLRKVVRPRLHAETNRRPQPAQEHQRRLLRVANAEFAEAFPLGEGVLDETNRRVAGLLPREARSGAAQHFRSLNQGKQMGLIVEVADQCVGEDEQTCPRSLGIGQALL